MSSQEQRRMISELSDHVRRMKGRDEYDYEMYRKRDKDDEELDELSMKRLRELYETYAGRRT